MSPSGPLPEHLVQGPVSYLAALAAGVTSRELAGELWSRPFKGVRVWSALELAPLQRGQAAALLLPEGGAVSGWAAAFALGATVLDGFCYGDGPLRLRQRPVPLIVPPPAQLRRRPGVDPWRCQLSPAERVGAAGMPVTGPIRTAFELARRPPRWDAVAAVDAMLHAKLLTRDQLVSAIEVHGGWKGVPLAREVARLCSDRAESPPETHLRLIAELGGLTGLRPNVAVYDLDGEFLARPDLLDEEAAVAHEYDGAVHADSARRHKDYRRQERLEAHGFIVVRYGPQDVYGTPEATLASMRAAHRRGLRRDRSRDRWQLSSMPTWLT